MVILQKWSLYWRENGHVMDVVSFMEEEWSFYRGAHLMDICIFYYVFYGQSVVFCFLYTVHLTFQSPHLPLPLHQCFPPHCIQGSGENSMPAKIEQVCQTREEE